MNTKRIKSVAIAAAFAHVFAYVLLFIFTLFVNRSGDPDRLLGIFGVLAMLMGGAFAGVLISLLWRERTLVIPAIGGGAYLALHLIISLLFSTGNVGGGILRLILGAIGVMAAALLFGWLVLPSGEKDVRSAKNRALVQYNKSAAMRKYN